MIMKIVIILSILALLSVRTHATLLPGCTSPIPHPPTSSPSTDVFVLSSRSTSTLNTTLATLHKTLPSLSLYTLAPTPTHTCEGYAHALVWPVTSSVFQTFDAATYAVSKVDLATLHPTSAGEREGEEAPWVDVGSLSLSEAKEVALAAITEDDFYVRLSQLSGRISAVVEGQTVSIPTRYTYSPVNHRAAVFVQELLEAQGLETELEEFSFKGTDSVNVVATKPGSGPRASEIVVIGAHFDSISGDPMNLAPGADDDGSGTIAVVLAAAALADIQFDRTIVFVAFSGEEQGLYGSKAYVDHLIKKGLNAKVVGAVCMDMISYSNKYFGVTAEGKNTAIQYASLLGLANANADQVAPQLSFVNNTRPFGSDHMSFLNANIPAILLIQRDDTDFPYYHSVGDTMDHVNKHQAVLIARIAAGMVWDLALPLDHTTPLL